MATSVSPLIPWKHGLHAFATRREEKHFSRVLPFFIRIIGSALSVTRQLGRVLNEMNRQFLAREVIAPHIKLDELRICWLYIRRESSASLQMVDLLGQHSVHEHILGQRKPWLPWPQDLILVNGILVTLWLLRQQGLLRGYYDHRRTYHRDHFGVAKT
ncbi:hypothetical protein ACFE04_008654 [Oxalis oulophora]